MLYVRHLVNLKEIPIQIYPRMSHMQPVCSSGRKKQHGSLIYFVPRGVMAFAARSATNSLASPDNLARWKKIVHPKCPLCQIPPCTLGHLLSNCQQALTRYEWRHNNIVKYLHSTATSQGMEAYADLEGCWVNGVALPANITITELKPNMVLINRKSIPQEVTLVELTVSWESSQDIEKVASTWPG